MKKKYIIVLSLVLLLIAGWTWRYVTMNTYFDSLVITEKETYQIGDVVSFEEDIGEWKTNLNGYSLRVDDFEVMDFENYADSIDFEPDEYYYAGEKVAIINVTLYNDNSEAEGVMLTDYNLYGIDQLINLDWDLLIAANPILEGNYGIKLLPGTECNLVLPYKLQREYFSTWTWNHFDDYDLYLKLTSFPTEKVIQVQ